MMSKQLTLFGHPLDTAPKDQMDFMRFPFLSLTKNPRYDTIIFNHQSGENEIHIEVKPGRDVALATIWDWDYMLFFGTQIRCMRDNGDIQGFLPEKTLLNIRFHGYEALSFVRKSGKGSKDYEAFRAALNRLSQATVITNRCFVVSEDGDKTKKRYIRDNLRFVNSWREVKEEVKYKRPGTKSDLRSACFEVSLESWFVNNYLDNQAILAINPKYFKLRGGVEKALYRIVRSYCGKQDFWQIGLVKFCKLIGSNAEPKEVKRALKSIIQKSTFPDYNLSLCTLDRGTMIKAFRKKGLEAIPDKYPGNFRIIAETSD
ncbi:MAG: replication initiator protein A [Bacteroidota bacterium]